MGEPGNTTGPAEVRLLDHDEHVGPDAMHGGRLASPQRRLTQLLERISGAFLRAAMLVRGIGSPERLQGDAGGLRRGAVQQAGEREPTLRRVGRMYAATALRVPLGPGSSLRSLPGHELPGLPAEHDRIEATSERHQLLLELGTLVDGHTPEQPGDEPNLLDIEVPGPERRSDGGMIRGGAACFCGPFRRGRGQPLPRRVPTALLQLGGCATPRGGPTRGPTLQGREPPCPRRLKACDRTTQPVQQPLELVVTQAVVGDLSHLIRDRNEPDHEVVGIDQRTLTGSVAITHPARRASQITQVS